MLSASMTAMTLGASVSSQYSATTLAPSGYSYCSRLATPSWKVKPGLVLSNVTNSIGIPCLLFRAACLKGGPIALHPRHDALMASVAHHPYELSIG